MAQQKWKATAVNISPVVCGDIVYCSGCYGVGGGACRISKQGERFQTLPDAYKELGRIKAVDGKCWSTPAYSDGRLYVRSTKEGACIDVK